MKLCGAKNRNGQPCQRPPLRGATRCRHHGGASPRAQQAAQARLAMQALAWEAERDRSPGDILYEAVWRAAAYAKGDAGPQGIELMAKVAKMAIDAGIAERQVRIAEEQGRVIADVIVGVLHEVGLDGEQEVRARQLAAVRLRGLAA